MKGYGYFAEDFHHNNDNSIGTGYRSPLPQKVQLAPRPKKQPVLALRKAKDFKRLRVWGLRK